MTGGGEVGPDTAPVQNHSSNRPAWDTHVRWSWHRPDFSVTSCQVIRCKGHGLSRKANFKKHTTTRTTIIPHAAKADHTGVPNSESNLSLFVSKQCSQIIARDTTRPSFHKSFTVQSVSGSLSRYTTLAVVFSQPVTYHHHQYHHHYQCGYRVLPPSGFNSTHPPPWVRKHLAEDQFGGLTPERQQIGIGLLYLIT